MKLNQNAKGPYGHFMENTREMTKWETNSGLWTFCVQFHGNFGIYFKCIGISVIILIIFYIFLDILAMILAILLMISPSLSAPRKSTEAWVLSTSSGHFTENGRIPVGFG